jgi:hypothetical protein
MKLSEAEHLVGRKWGPKIYNSKDRAKTATYLENLTLGADWAEEAFLDIPQALHVKIGIMIRKGYSNSRITREVRRLLGFKVDKKKERIELEFKTKEEELLTVDALTFIGNFTRSNPKTSLNDVLEALYSCKVGVTNWFNKGCPET